MPSPHPIQPGIVYHIFNRGNNGGDLFFEDRNYKYFLDLYIKYIEPVAATYAYCLMKNHFHVMVRIYTPEEQAEVSKTLHPDLPFREINPSQAFGNLFNAYAKAIEKAYGLTGSLFEHPFHRVPVLSDAHFGHLVIYIHHNPQKHGFVKDFRDWIYSSYGSLLSLQATRLQRETTLGWFSGLAGLREAHLFGETSEEIDYLIERDVM